eukprot:NODE_1566_length_909_cov_53.258140_g1219_i0.p1 GENE.NODE_1566_length_909_cov_53.258140_g1219_i0~~NODE_1566_length_909_cov_53.258140_g1219_i0.p1  ORF type:complete len:185 (-),score=30.78 NODE_1566_length_909_cov_53.258140_g1219_i0:354-878(-)
MAVNCRCIAVTIVVSVLVVMVVVLAILWLAGWLPHPGPPPSAPNEYAFMNMLRDGVWVKNTTHCHQELEQFLCSPNGYHFVPPSPLAMMVYAPEQACALLVAHGVYHIYVVGDFMMRAFYQVPAPSSPVQRPCHLTSLFETSGLINMPPLLLPSSPSYPLILPTLVRVLVRVGD